MLHLVPITRDEAKAFVRAHHRHHLPPVSHKFSLAVADEDGKVRGVAMVGRPVARALDDGWTLEVTRVATDGARNACSMLYGAAWRACRALGYRKLVTYTLPEEGGGKPTGRRVADRWRVPWWLLVAAFATACGPAPSATKAALGGRVSGYRKGSAHADSARRLKGADGTWPTSMHKKQGERVLARIGEKELFNEPKPPAIGYLYEDLNERAKRVPKAVFGQYPRSLIPKLLPWLRCERREILHVCSGSLPPGEGIRVDIREDAHPDILADGRHLPLADGSVAAVMLDPPYTKQYAKDLYGIDYPRPSHLLREAARVVRPCGRIAFVHYIVPNPPPGCTFVRAFGLSVGFGFPMRAVTIYERAQAELELAPPERP